MNLGFVDRGWVRAVEALADFAKERGAVNGGVEVEDGQRGGNQIENLNPVVDVIGVELLGEKGHAGEGEGIEGIAVAEHIDVDDAGEAAVVDEDIFGGNVVEERDGRDAGEISVMAIEK